MSRGICAHCSRQWDTDTDAAQRESYFFSSASYAKGSYVSAATILGAGETILTCPLDASKDTTKLGYAEDSFTPGGASMATGDDRLTEGDEDTSGIPAPRYPNTIIHQPGT